MAKEKLTGNAKFIAVMKKTSGRCYYCGLKNWPTRSLRQQQITIDHILPRILGGTDEMDNLVPCCRECNSAKAARPVEELRHHTALRAAKMPKFSRDQILWMRKAGLDLTAYDGFQFWFERRTLPGT
jgi:5-methylcytosine-specific restriction endonuclease McrA